MKYVILIIASYLVGSIPFGVILAAAYGKDLRSIGSGNIGATNLARALGRRAGLVCFALDCLKGLFPMLAVTQFISTPASGAQLALWLAVGCAAIFGHNFPIYLKFKGGKGVATSLGVVLGLWPYYTICGLIAFGVWAVFVLIWRYISLASIAAAVAFPVCLVVAIALIEQWRFATLWPLLAAAFVMPALVIARHRGNIKRLLAGTESKVLAKKT